jgi:multicomponent K+:H+ antiporter subunit D
VLALLLAGSLFSLIALARAGSLFFLRPAAPDSPPPPTTLPVGGGGLLPALGLLALCVAMTVAAGPLQRETIAIATQLLEPARYIDAVLGGRP